MTTLADDLLLVLLDPESGKPRTDGTRLDYGLAGALLLELALTERVDLVGPKPAKAQVVLVDDALPDDDLLADAVRMVARKRRRADALVPALAKRLRGRLLERAERRGDVRRERLTLRPDRWPAADDARRRTLTTRLHDVLLTGVTPDARTAALVSLLAAIDAAPAAVDVRDRTTRKAVARRAAEIGEGTWAAESVRRAVKAAHDAVVASTAAIVATTVATTS
ncbi:MAG TPA: GPP34 family phosphoprotein [Kineosporiaceae bacterium]|nr:GPP34 family phosphoprotein [Kineosporiaceae bacterium]